MSLDLIETEDKLSNKIGGVFFGLTILLMAIPFTYLVNINNFYGDVFEPVYIKIATCVCFALFAIPAALFIYGAYEDKEIGQALLVGYDFGKLPIIHLLVFVHGLLMSVLIWLATNDAVIPNIGMVSTDTLLDIMDKYNVCVIIYLFSAIIGGLIFTWQIMSSDSYKSGMSIKHNLYLLKRDQKAETKYAETSADYNAKVEQLISEISTIDVDNIDHGQFQEMK